MITVQDLLNVLNENANIQILSNDGETDEPLWEGDDRENIPEEYLDMQVWDTYPYENTQIICI